MFLYYSEKLVLLKVRGIYRGEEGLPERDEAFIRK